MSSSSIPPEFENRPIKIEIDGKRVDKVYLKDAMVEQGLSKITKTTIELLTFDTTKSVEDFLGKPMVIIYPDEQENEHFFSGTCVAIEDIGRYMGGKLFIADVRPWLWFLKRKRDNRVFQDMTTVEIIKQILQDMEMSGHLITRLNDTYLKREYCVQYRESCYDFICRLMEEDGIYFYFEQDGKQEKLVLADGPAGHKATPGHAEYEFFYPDQPHRETDFVSYWVAEESVRTGKVTLKDYNFIRPDKDLKKLIEDKKGNHKYGTYEHYDYPGGFRSKEDKPNDEDKESEDHAKARMQSISSQAVVHKGVANIKGMAVGQTFKLKADASAKQFVPDGKEFMIRNAAHYIGVDTDKEEDKERGDPDKKQDEAESNVLLKRRAKPADIGKAGVAYRCTFDVIPKAVPYRAPQVTPKPEIAGLQTAVVVGPNNEDIYTDKYGRIKVQFHWDRKGELNEKSSCWVRVVMPWSGTNWGMISIPRIGNEVVIQFEEGDPDRPICTGMVYRQTDMPPYDLEKENIKNQTGIVTRSTKAGSKNAGNAKTFHELIFDDTLEAEVVRFQSERDYKQTIRNNADITIGLEHKDKGNLTQTIHNDRTETVNEGNHTFTVKKGNETYKIEQGNQTIEVGKDQSTTVKGKTTHETTRTTLIKANQKITLECGPSKIEMTPTGIKITAPKIDIESQGMLNAKAMGMLTAEAQGMTTVKSSAMLMLQGAMIKIN